MLEYRRLGRSGLKISPLALGTLNFGNPTSNGNSFKIIDRAIEAGINLFNLTDVYGKGRAKESGVKLLPVTRREKLWLGIYASRELPVL